MVKNKEEFLQKSTEVHGDKYDYSKVEYTKSINKVVIICKIHGDFCQTPHIHIKGAGCKKCTIDKKIHKLTYTTDKFVSKAKEKHGELYDYSKVDYENTKTSIIIICKKHGEFNQLPHNHLNGRGCKKCSFKIKSIRQTFTNERFIEISKELYPNKFDYTDTNFINTRSRVNLKCIKHNIDFETGACMHLKKNTPGGCPKCIYEKYSQVRVKPQDQFIKECQDVHKNRYDYSKVVYINSNKKINIICNIHGEFKQQAQNHIQGRGCPMCHIHKNENECKNVIERITGEYFIRERPKFLKRLEYDGYNDDLKLGFEYNGIQHYEYVPFFHSNNKRNFEKQKENDIKKIELSHLNGIFLIVVPYCEVDKEKYIIEKYNEYLFLRSCKF